jgi:choline kinase
MYAGLKNTMGDFFVLMADHLIEHKAFELFHHQVKVTHSAIPLLACDLTLKNTFDMDDATKVFLHNDKIVNIGKNLQDFNAIDMGLFFFPDASRSIISHAVASGSLSMTEIVQCMLKEGDFFAVPMKNIKWQDIDTPAMLQHAKQLF